MPRRGQFLAAGEQGGDRTAGAGRDPPGGDGVPGAAGLPDHAALGEHLHGLADGLPGDFPPSGAGFVVPGLMALCALARVGLTPAACSRLYVSWFNPAVLLHTRHGLV